MPTSTSRRRIFPGRIGHGRAEPVSDAPDPPNPLRREGVEIDKPAFSMLDGRTRTLGGNGGMARQDATYSALVMQKLWP